MTEQKNLILAIALSILILVGFQVFFAPPLPEPPPSTSAEGEAATGGDTGTAPVPSVGAPPAIVPGTAPDVQQDRSEALAAVPRIQVRTPTITGSIATMGARIDDVILTRYHETLAADSELIHLLEPTSLAKPYYAEFGWVTEPNVELDLPDAATEWTASAGELTPGAPVTLSWTNGQGLVFTREISVDDGYMFTVIDRVRNTGERSFTLFPYGLLSRGGTPETTGFYILHEGALGVFDGTLSEIDYDDLREEGRTKLTSPGGWIGITDKYWLAALVPDQGQTWEYSFNHSIRNQDDRYQVDYVGGGMDLAAGAQITSQARLFAGAKLVTLLDRYETEYGITNFDLAIDFGWFYFLTKPFFFALAWLNGVLGNFGLAILALTVVIKLVFFPLANKSYKSMAKMKELTPKLQEMREKYGDDRQRLNEEMMALYKREKVNPAAGCLPILIQIPVFFALYKVLFVNIEMRHAPFYGWIRDLSAPDPTTLFNLFGLIPWDPPLILMVGAWPVLMGLTMYLQQKLNPQPADPIQAKVFLFLPLVFTFLLSQFAAGLVIYWTWNNLLSILQQWVIMKRMGVKNALA